MTEKTYSQVEVDKLLEAQKENLKEETKDWVNNKAKEIAEGKAIVLAEDYKELSPEMKSFEDSKKMIQYYIEGWALPSDMNEQKMMMLKWFWDTMWLSLMECINWMAFINGRPTIYGSVFLGLLVKNKYKITFLTKTEVEVEVEIEWPNGKQKWYFSEEMAKTAWIWKNVYLKYPIRMLSYKAIREAQNFLCPEILWGVVLAEEVNEYPNLDKEKVEEEKKEKLENRKAEVLEKYKK